MGSKKADRVEKLNSHRDTLRTLIASQWHSHRLDALLTSANPSAASAHNESRYWGYTSVFNALDLPGIVFPVTSVLPTDDWGEDVGEVCGDKDAEYRGFWSRGGAERYRDAPVGLQLVGKRLQEERLMAVAGVVEGVLGRARGVGREVGEDELVQSRL